MTKTALSAGLMNKIFLFTGEAYLIGMEHCADRARCIAVLDRLYSFLGVLDGKANGLLRITGVFIGLIGLGGFIHSKQAGTDLPDVVKLLLLITLMAFIVASFLCMMIVRMEWHFLEKIDIDGYAEQHSTDLNHSRIGSRFKREIEDLAEVVVSRTNHYNLAWWLAMIGFAALFIAFFWLAVIS
jgi:hypothetical protein